MKIVNFKSEKFWALFIVIIGIAIFLPSVVQAFSVKDTIVEGLGYIIWFLWLTPMLLILQGELFLLPIIASYNGFTTAGGVLVGWKALRDLANMFFILILLVIAFATILGIERYGYKSLLKRLIYVAVLINFSMTLVGLLIDISQVIMLTFVQAIRDVAVGNIAVAFGLGDIFNLGNSGATESGLSFANYITALLLGGIMVTIVTVVVGTFIIMLAMRIVKLWILIVVSPLAFLAYTFPKTESYFSKWTEDLTKNLIIGPMLAFFLWLSFTIVGRGNIYEDFNIDNPDQQIGQNVSGATTKANFTNFIIALALLVGGLSAASSSGAFGASIAAKASGVIKAGAAKRLRRYPGAIASRAGVIATRGVIDKEGRLKGAAKALPFVLPRWGRMIQRSAHKMQGYDAARIQQEKTEDEKYIKPTHKVEFEASQATLAQQKGKTRRRLGKAYSALTIGGAKDRELMQAQNIIDRGEDTVQNSEWLTDRMRTAGDEERMEKVQANYWTFKDKEEAMRIIRKRGLKGVLTDVKSEGLYELDEAGNIEKDEKTGKDVTKDSTLYALQAIHDPSHGHADHNAITAAIHSNTKVDRWAIENMIRDNFGTLFLENLIKDTGIDTSDGVSPDKRHIADNNLSNPAIIAGQQLAKEYIQKMGAVIDEKTGKIKFLGPDAYIYARQQEDLRQTDIKPGQIAENLYRWHDEDDSEFNDRKQRARELDEVFVDDPNSMKAEYLKEKFIEGTGKNAKIKEKEFEEYRQKMYRQLLDIRQKGVAPEMRSGEEYFDFYDNSHVWDGLDRDNPEAVREAARLYVHKYKMPAAARSDIIRQEATFAKESEAGVKQRQTLYDKYKIDSNQQREIDEAIDKVTEVMTANIEKLAPGISKISTNAEQDVRERLAAQVAGDKRKSFNWPAKSFYTEVQDGAHGSRLMEANVGNVWERAMMDQGIAQMEKQQQAQAFAVGTDTQNTYLVNKIVDFGMLPQKALVENIPKPLAAKAMQALADITAMRRMELPQDFNIIGPNMKKLLAILQYKAENEEGGAIAVSELINREVALKDMVNNFNEMFGGKGVKIDLDTNMYHEPGQKPIPMDDYSKKNGYHDYEIQKQPPPEEDKKDKSKGSSTSGGASSKTGGSKGGKKAGGQGDKSDTRAEHEKQPPPEDFQPKEGEEEETE